MNPFELAIPSSVRVIFFDMDHTLISTDCDVTWKEFLTSKGMAGLLDRFLKDWHYFQYRRGKLNIHSFMKFQLSQFRNRTRKEMLPLLEEHFERIIKPALYAGVREWIGDLRKKGIRIVLCTATNEAIARPLYDYLEMDDMIATRLEVQNGCYTGYFIPPYVGGADKLIPMREWLKVHGFTLTQSSYWGDSRSDIPVLEAVGFPVAANPQDVLLQTARKRNWTVVNFSK